MAQRAKQLPKAATKEGEKLLIEAYDAYADAIFRHCYFRVFSRERAKELMQETFLRAWDQMVKGEEIRHMRGFLYRVANNLIIDESRKKRSNRLRLLRKRDSILPIELRRMLVQKIWMRRLFCVHSKSSRSRIAKW